MSILLLGIVAPLFGHSGAIASSANGLDVTYYVSDRKLTPAEVAKLRSEPATDLQKDMRAKGAVVVVGKTHNLIISEPIWQADRMQRAVEIRGRILKAIGSDGSVDLSDPEVAGFARGAADHAGVDIGPDTKVIAAVHGNITMGAGGKQFSIPSQMTPPGARSDLAMHPCVVRSDPSSKVSPDRKAASAVSVIFPSRFNFYRLSSGATDRASDVAAYVAALDLVQSHFKQFTDARTLARNDLERRLSGMDLPNLSGKATTDTPDWFQNQLNSQFGSDYGRYGFGSRADALSFVSSASFLGASATPGLLFALPTNGGLQNFLGYPLP